MSAWDSFTQLFAGTGGDKIYNEDLGAGVKMASTKIHVGAGGVDGGPVAVANPLSMRQSDGSAFISPALDGTLTGGSLVAVMKAADVSSVGANITAAGTQTAITTTGYGSITFQLSGTWVGTVQWEASADGANYLPVRAYTTNATGGPDVATTTTGNCIATIACASFAKVRINCTAYTSGTIASSSVVSVLTRVHPIILAASALTGASVPSNALAIGVKDGSGNLANLTLGQALAASSVPVVLPAIQSAALAQDASILARCLLGLQATTSSRSVVAASDRSMYVLDCTPTGLPWTTSIGAAITLTAAGSLVVPATAGQYLRSISIQNPTNGTAIFYWIYHGAAPAWSGSALVITAGKLIAEGTVNTVAGANVLSDNPGGLLVPNGVTVVIAASSGIVTNTAYSAPASACWATLRYGV